MKILTYSLIVFRLLDLYIPTQPATSLHELISFTEVHEYKIESGELLMKETFKMDQINQIEQRISDAGFYQTESHTDSVNNKYERRLGEGIFEEIKVLKTQDTRELTVNYHLSGDVIQLVHSAKYNDLVKSFLVTIYTKDKRDYACVSLSSHDRMSKGHFLNKLQENLQYEEIDRIKEPDMTVISAYSAQLSQAIPIKDKQMNLQIVARQGTDQKINVLIGTPILTTEY